MRILIHGINFAPELTGIGKYSGEMAWWLAKCGHEVHVITAPPYYPFWSVQKPYSALAYKREYINGVKIYRCPLWVPRKPTGFKRIVHLVSFAAASLPVSLMQVIWRPNIVFTIAPTLFGVAIAALTAKLANAKSWLHVQDLELDAATSLGIVSGGIMVRIVRWLECQLIRRFDRVSSISGAMLNRLEEKGVERHKLVLFENWVDTEEIKPINSTGSLRNEWGISQASRVIVYSGNVGKKQGLDVILRVAEIMCQIRWDVVFVIVGEGAAREDLEQKTMDMKLTNVQFKPLLPAERLPELLSLADVHLVLQRHGAADLVMPSKLAPILAAGGVALVTAEKGTELYHLVHDNKIGMVVEAESESAIVSGLQLLLDDVTMCSTFKKNAREYACKAMDRKMILHKFQNHLEALVD